jgi:tetratricopeptide (TPR) repeat protein
MTRSSVTQVKPRAWHIVLLVLATLLAYGNALDAGFQFDDFNVIVLNDAVHSLQAWWASMPGIRPLLKLAYTANWVLDTGPRGFHLANLGIHLGNVLLVYLLIGHWAARLAPPGSRADRIALLASLVFALHPANTEAVTYVSGRSVSLMALFYLAALVLYTRQKAPDARAMVLAALAFVLALGVKEIAVILPVVLLLVLGLTERARLRATWPIWLVLGAAVAALLGFSHYRNFFAHSLETRGLAENLVTQIEGLHYLVTRPLFGLRLNIDPHLPAPAALTAALAWKLAPHAAALLIAVWQWRKRPWLSLGILWFYLHLAPTNSLLARYDVANDRQFYLAMLGPAFILAVLVQRLAWPLRWPALAALLITLGLATHTRNLDYRDEISLWTATTRDTPGKARPWNNLGYAFQLAGRRDEAIAAYRRALEIDPVYDKAKANLRQLGIEVE